MSYFAKVPSITDGKGIVDDVISASQDVINSGDFGDPLLWVETSPDTYGNANPNGTPLRANYAGIGYTYDSTITINNVVGVFYAPQPYASWLLSNTTWLWEAPVPMPKTGGPYYWDESTLSWVQIPTGV
jgi:hypothetical protein